MFEKYYINSGIGYGNSYLTSFDAALLHSGVGNYNLVRVSSILPVGVARQKSIDIKAGSQLHIAYAEISSNNSGDILSAAVSVGIPANKLNIGVIMELALYNEEKETVKRVEEMVKEAMVNRGYEIEQIITYSCEAIVERKGYTTAFSGIAMW